MTEVGARADLGIHAEAARIAELCKALSLRAASIGWSEVAAALEALPATLREVRTREHLTVRDIETLTGVPYSSVSRFERGNNDLYLSNALALVRWLAERGEVRETRPRAGTQPHRDAIDAG